MPALNPKARRVLLLGVRTVRAVEISRALPSDLVAESASVNAALQMDRNAVAGFATILLDATAFDGDADALAAAVLALSTHGVHAGRPRLLVLVDETDEAACRAAAEAGAWDLLPLGSDAAEIAARLEETVRLDGLEEFAPPAARVARPEAPPDDGGSSRRLIGGSQGIVQLLALIRRLAISDVPVLITGESGTGKELTALAVHERSRRASGPFVPIDCAAIPENLLESELFGHEKGAFTGATTRRPGRIEMAEGGTLFLDEIGDLSLPLQVKLLRFLEDHRIQYVGSDKSRPVDVRIVAATHCDLAADVRDGRFREDLFYRINVFTLEVPPLRDREGDVVVLAKHFLEVENERSARDLRGFTPEAIAALCREEWPGNVRELENCVRRAVVVADGDLVTPADLGLDAPGGAYRGPTLHEARDRAESEAVLRALEVTGGNKSEAARLLGISRTQLYEVMSRHHIGEQ